MKKSPVSLPRVMLAALSVGVFASCSSSIQANRPVAADGRAIHRPEQLDDFVLAKPVEIRGLGTKAALEKLDREYRETCRKAGEVPLDLRYEVPAGYDRPLSLTGWSFGRAVSEIAATSKLELKRRGTTYHLQAPRENDRLVRETYGVPPDFLARISREAYDRKLPIRAAFEKRGVSFDESTQLTLRGAKLGVETRDRGDRAAISGMVNSVVRESPKQLRLNYRTFEVPADHSWEAPANGLASDSDLAELRRTPGVREFVPPEWSIDATRFYLPSINRQPGKTLRFQANPLGLGVQVKAEFDQTTRGSKPVVISVEGQTPAGGTRIATTTRADGSRVVLAVTPTIIDATGRPVKKSR